MVVYTTKLNTNYIKSVISTECSNLDLDLAKCHAHL